MGLYLDLKAEVTKKKAIKDRQAENLENRWLREEQNASISPNGDNFNMGNGDMIGELEAIKSLLENGANYVEVQPDKDLVVELHEDVFVEVMERLDILLNKVK